MKFVNNNNKPVKVERENTNPAENTTLKRDGTIECESEKYAKYYKEKGLTQVGMKDTVKAVVKGIEGKAGAKKVETKVLDKELVKEEPKKEEKKKK